MKLLFVVVVVFQISIFVFGISDQVNYFSDSYATARLRFKEEANKCGAEMYELPVLNVQGLVTDVAVLRGISDQFFIHVSGTHGAEGYAGSAIQIAILSDICASYNAEEMRHRHPTLVFVHALNPYGFANNRRVNEDNIDLNRNFLTQKEFEFVKSRDPNYAGYMDMSFLMNPTPDSLFVSRHVTLWNDICTYAKAAIGALIYGVPSIKKALVSGNYHLQKGLGFGGFSQAKSTSNLIEFLMGDELGMIKSAKKVIMIDVHTGLGPEGVDTITTEVSTKSGNVPDSKCIDENFERFFPTEWDPANIAKKASIGGIKTTSGDGQEAMSGYDETIGTTGYFFWNLLLPSLQYSKEARGQSTFVIQEFGTVPSIFVGMALVDENYYHQYGTDSQKAAYSARLRDVFFVNSTSWKTAIVHRGVMVFNQAIALLGSNYRLDECYVDIE